MQQGRITGPTCAGKTVISEAILRQRPNAVRAISVTTRPPRKNEMDGKDYFFVSQEAFQEKIAKNEFVEYCKVYGEYYGTSKDSFRPIVQGCDVMKVIDVQGALKLKEQIQGTFFFFAPKNREIIRRRLEAERSDANNIQRLQTYEKEIVWKEHFDHNIDTSGDTPDTTIMGCARSVMELMNEVK